MEGFVVAYDLGPCGSLLEVKALENFAGTVSVKATPFVIVDRSGSMGANCEYAISHSVPSALIQCGYTQNFVLCSDLNISLEADQVVLVTFDSVTERVYVRHNENPTIADLRKMSVKCRGSTVMAGVIEELRKALDKSSAYHVIVISDGEIGDQVQTRDLALHTIAGLTQQQKNTRLTATLVRYFSSSYAAPDTTALSCIGNFCNTGQKTDVIDVDSSGGLEVGVSNLTNALVTSCIKSGNGVCIEIGSSDGSCIFKQTPMSQAVPVLTIPANGTTTTLLLTGPPPKTIRIGTKEYEVVNAGVPQSADVLDSFVDVIGSQLRMSVLAANGNVSADVQASIDQTLKYLSDIQSFIDSVKVKALENADVTLAGKARAIAKSIKSRTASAIDRLRQQLNSGKVSSLNAQQKADWLRGVTDNKSGRALARRADGADPEQDSRKAITRLRDALLSVAETEVNDVSFYSQATALESLETVKELAPIVDEVGLSDWQQVIGGLGVPVRHHVGDYVDPWNVRVQEVYCGTTLSECDVFSAAMQSGAATTNALKCPGKPDAEISAVIPLITMDQAAYKLYMMSGRELAECQASAQMRRAVTCLPHDVIAFSAAGLWSLVRHYDVTTLSSVERATIAALHQNIDYLIGTAYKSPVFKQLHDDLLRPDPRPWLSGVNDVTNVLKPIATIVKFGWAGPTAARALFSFETFQQGARTFRSAEDSVLARRTALHELLKIDFTAKATPTTPLFELEPKVPLHYSTITLDQLVAPKWVPDVRPYVGVHSLLTNAPSSDVLTFGCSAAVLKVVAAVQAIECSGEASRIDTKNLVALVPDVFTDEHAIRYLSEIQTRIYAEEYQKRVNQKKAEEERITTERVVKQLVDTTTFEEFKALLCSSKIDNRDHVGFGKLFTTLIGSDSLANSCTQQKLGLLLTGRDINVPDVEVWANGNVWNQWKKFADGQKHFTEAIETQIVAIADKYGVYKYKRGGKNRHKHSNTFPSYWALGYKDLSAMRAAVSDAEFKIYVHDHCVTNGCCMPNVGERQILGLK